MRTLGWLLIAATGCTAEGSLEGAPTSDASEDTYVAGDSSTTDSTSAPSDTATAPTDAASDSATDTTTVADAAIACPTTAWASDYTIVPTVGAKSDRPPAEHADLNVKLRGFTATGGTLGLIDVGGPTDDKAPKLWSFFADSREPKFVANFKVHDWDWSAGKKGGPIASPDVTAVDFATKPGEDIKLPTSGYVIAPGLSARVLFLDEDSITLKYTGEDNVVSGYTLHVLDVCIEPKLRAAYVDANAKGRSGLPGVATGHPFARAKGARIRAMIRDTGAFMDPRVRKDWWPK